MKEIFKLQASQMPYHDTVLVYNESRKTQKILAMSGSLEKFFEKHGEKFYAEAELNQSSEGIRIDKVLTTNPQW